MKSNQKASSTRPSDAFKRKIEVFRAHYKSEYDVELDSETIYFFIRVNEMQAQLEKKIEKIPEVRFRNGWDYFLYGLGRAFIWLCLVFIMIVSMLHLR